MDTQSLIAEAKARFAHNSAKHYLAEKFSNKLLVADQGGLWKADAQTISFLNAFTSDKIVLLDIYNNPVEVNRTELLSKLITLYETIMKDWCNEWKDLENSR
jgi:hypothetical protein